MLKLERQPEKRKAGNPKYISYDEEEDVSKTVQSQIVPAHLLKDIAAKPASEPSKASGGFKKAKPTPAAAPAGSISIDEELDEDELEEMYISRLEFDQEPTGCHKRLLPKLANFLTSDGFQKKRLQLLFRRSSTSPNTFGQHTDIFGKNSLLVVICTRNNQVIGGFTSI